MTRHRRAAAGIALGLAAALGCGGGDAEPPGDAARGNGAVAVAPPWRTATDTTGDTVVVRTSGATDEAAALRLVEELRIGELEGADEYRFGDVGLVLPASGDGVYVWDHIVAALRQYDGRGRFVRRIGRFGRGPGEYQAGNGLVQLRDGRLVLWDPENLRMNVYDSTGGVLGSWRHESTLGVRFPWGLLADTADNVYAIHWFRSPDGRPTLPAEREGYRVLGPDGVLRDSVPPPSWLPRAAVIVATGAEGGANRSPVPFAPQPEWALSRFGYVVSVVGDRYAVTLHRPEGPLRIERDVAPVPLDPDERANAEEVAVAGMRQMDPSWRWNGPQIPRAKPLVVAIRAAADGRIWVQRSAPGVRAEPDGTPPAAIVPPIGGGGPPVAVPPRRWRDPVVFDVFARDGRLLGTLAVPERARLLHLRGDHAWGVERDEMDVPFVVRWRLEPSLAARERAP